MAGLFRVYARPPLLVQRRRVSSSICPETRAWSKIAARPAFTGADDAAEAAALPARAARSFRYRTEWSCRPGNRSRRDWPWQSKGGGDGQDGLRGRPLRSVRKNILNWSCRNPNKTYRFESVRAGSGLGVDVKRGEGQKAQAEKSPEGDQHEGTAQQTGAYVSALSPSADGPTVPGPLSDRGAVRTGRRVTPSPRGC